MSILSDLVRNIVVIILLTTFLEMLLPSGTMKRYVKVVMGVFVLLTVLSPFSRLLKGGDELAAFDWSSPEAASGYVSVLEEGNRLNGVNREILKNNYAQGIEQQVISLVKLVEGVATAQATVDLQITEDGNLQGISLVIIKVSTEDADADTDTDKSEHSIVEPIKIEASFKGRGKGAASGQEGLTDAEGAEHQATVQREKNIEGEIKKTIAKYLAIRPEQIRVTFVA